jgi:hypothetical protein
MMTVIFFTVSHKGSISGKTKQPPFFISPTERHGIFSFIERNLLKTNTIILPSVYVFACAAISQGEEKIFMGSPFFLLTNKF